LNGIGILNLSVEHTAAISTLPFHHRDPFDRLIVVQAKIEKMPLVSADPAFDAYEIERVW
jgi:PIN domain nuclease of toxin-antitoxin system